MSIASREYDFNLGRQSALYEIMGIVYREISGYSSASEQERFGRDEIINSFSMISEYAICEIEKIKNQGVNR